MAAQAEQDTDSVPPGDKEAGGIFSSVDTGQGANVLWLFAALCGVSVGKGVGWLRTNFDPKKNSWSKAIL